MKFIKLFNEQTEFDAAKGTLYNPNVSYIKGNGGVYSLGYTYVDFGLPSRTLWAKCNVGAEKETDYGFYFQWGDIKNKSNAECSWTTYKHCDSTFNSLKKYNNNSSYGANPDNIKTLKPVDDAATQIMGDEWRMPTKADFQELIDNTDHEWVENFNESGVNGIKLTSKADTSKYIFIPAAGFIDSSSCNGGPLTQGAYVTVWSSSLYESEPDQACDMRTDNGARISVSPNNRYRGAVVRGVTKRQDA